MGKPTDSASHKYMFSDDMKFLQKVIVIHPYDASKFLILKRAMYHKYRPGDWDLPGGNVLYGEDAVESVKREVREETGLEIHDLKPIEVTTRPQFEGNIYLLIIDYKATANTELVNLSEEHTEYKWVTVNEFLNLDPADFLKELVRRYYSTSE